MELTKYFGKIKNNQIDIRNEINNNNLFKLLKENIGNTNPYIRDNLVYEILERTILDNCIDEKEIIFFSEQLLSNDFLFLNINKKNDFKSVFTRSFSALQIPVILEYNKNKKILSNNYINSLIEKLKSYVKLEHDIRGYVNNYGWAHSIAHIADAIKYCFMTLNLNINQSKMLYSSLITLIEKADNYLIHKEMQRVAKAMNSYLTNSNQNILIDYIQNNFKLDKIFTEDFNKKKYFKINNLCDFMTALYFYTDLHDLKDFLKIKIMSYL